MVKVRCSAMVVVEGLPEMKQLHWIYINQVKSLGFRAAPALERLLEFKTSNNSLVINLKKSVTVGKHVTFFGYMKSTSHYK